MRRFLALFAVFGLVACEDDIVTEIEPVLVIEPTHLDFGVVELTQQESKTVRIENLQTVTAEIRSVEVVDDCGGCFVAENAPSEIVGYNQYDLAVRFRAIRLEVATGTVTLTTNDAKAPVQTVTLIGRGTDSRKPDIEVIPQALDFGFVPSGGIGVVSFVVRSTGTNNLLVDRMRIEPADAPFRITTSTPTPERPGELEPGAQASFPMRVELPASQTGTVTAALIIETNVLEEKNVPGQPGVVRMPLKALGNLPPVAVVNEDQNVEPWSRVNLDGSESFDQDNPPNEPLSFLWTMIQTPEGSTTQLERTTTPLPSFWADLTGTYEIQLVVIDSLGLESEPATVVIEALPTNAVRIELTWDHPDSDVDLHLIRENGAFCDCGSDVHYRDCGRTPNWFPQNPGANPRLDLDDRSGFGPENINIDGDGPDRFIPPGRYTLAVHYYASNSEVSSWPTSVSVATVRVFIYGLLAGELTQPLVNDGDVWIAGTLDWPSQTITADGTILSGAECGVF